MTRIACVCGAVVLALGVSLEGHAEERLMQVDGAELPYFEEGSGAPLLFLHGAISDARVWKDYASRVAESRRFIAYTQRYFGTREWPDDGSRFQRETHVADLIAFVEGLGAGPVDLVTWSYSGEVATYAALRRPDLFRSVVHFEPVVDALLAELPGADAANREFASELGTAIAALEAGKTEEAALRFIEAVFRMPEGAAAQEPAPFPTYWRQNGRTLPHFVSMSPGDALSCDSLGRLDTPMLVVVGDRTLTRYAMVAERLANCAGNALLVPLDGATHDGPYRHRERFLDLVMAFQDLVGPAADGL